MSWLISLVVSWFILTTALWIASAVVPGFEIRSFKSAFGVAALFAILNVLVGWLLWSIITIGTLGIALLLAFITKIIINAILLKLTDLLTDSLTIKGFLSALWAAVVLALSSTGIEWILERLGVHH